MAVQMVKRFGSQPREAKVEDGLYKVKLVQIGEPKMYPGYNGGPETEKCRFVFEITKDYDTERENNYRGEELSTLVNINATSEKSTLYKITRAITGKRPEELGDFDIYELYGQECKVTVQVKYSEDGQSSFANIADFQPLRPIAPAPQPIQPKVISAPAAKSPVGTISRVAEEIIDYVDAKAAKANGKKAAPAKEELDDDDF